MSCVSSSSISILLNGSKIEPFHPSRDIRQGDPCSLYLFTMCMKVLGFLISRRCEENLWDPVQALRGGQAFSHLFFADDLVLFAKANLQNCISVKETLDTFCELSGQKVSLNKSKVYFSQNTRPESREEMCGVLGIHSTPNLGKYLGFPIKHPGSTSQDINFVVERVQNKLQGWKTNLLLMAGRAVIAQSVLSAILAYVMQGCMLPTRILNNLDKVSKNIVWGSTEDHKKLHMVGWGKVTKPKCRGGLGIQEARGRNLTLDAKLCWRMENSKSGGWADVLRKKYMAGPTRKPKAHTSPWNAVKIGRSICGKGSKWTMGYNSPLSF